MFDTSTADAKVARDSRILDAIDQAQDEVAAALERLIDTLSDEGVIHIHREWPAFAERKLIRETATKAALVSVLTNDWMGELPPGVAILETAREAINAVAAQ